jgi:tetratricopeptide (TPR) repeat protein
MIVAWLKGREAAEAGASLADEFAGRIASPAKPGVPVTDAGGPLQHLLRRADTELRPLQLNFFKKAKLANSFKWRLIESGVAREVADDVTQSLVLHLSRPQPSALIPDAATPPGPVDKTAFQQLIRRANKSLAQRAYDEAVSLYEQALEIDPSSPEAVNNLGASLSYLGRDEEAEQCFRQSIALKPDYVEAHGNLGSLLRQKGDFVGAEAALRRALKLRPTLADARTDLGLTLTSLGRLRDARACFAKALKSAPRSLKALYGVGQIATLEGRFEEADATFKRIIELDPKMPLAWAALARTRKMTQADRPWFERAEQLATSGIRSSEEADLRFALGKYCDDVDEFDRAFENFKRGNELLKAGAEDYDRKQQSRLIDDLIRGYSREAISKLSATGSSSSKPVFVVGMPRSGTSLAERIIASHPAAYGAGELPFWEMLTLRDAGITQAIMSDSARSLVAEQYLRVLEGHSADALRVVDKAPVNSHFLGIIYSVFPNARVIYMQRNPIDTCLSCYFQRFLTSLNFTFDLSDLAHYYVEHQRVMAHWRAVLPPGFMLDVPYEELVADQETWSRRMLEFIGLEWDPRCLDFHMNKRPVATASAWQVRQKVYQSSVARWRHYEKFIGPLKRLDR